MINIKWGIVSAVAAFALAFVLSLLIGHTGPLIALLRAGIFAVLFFGMGLGIWALLNTFTPELLSSIAENEITDNVLFGGGAGSRVNIMVDDAPNDAASPAMPEEDEAANTDEVGNFTDLLVAGLNKPPKDIDQTPATSYTEETEGFAPAFESVKPAETGNFSMDFGAFVPDGVGTDEMGDLDMGEDLFPFLSGSDSEGPGEIPEPERKASGNKSMKLEGDFDPKEIAAGIRTVLEKDKKRG
jgi:hypothetical protein